MKKLTPELLNKILESGVPIVDITLEDLMKAEVVKPNKE
jgi:hypothetical protein